MRPDGGAESAFTPHILVVDADADTRALYHYAFTDAGCHVVEASDGHGALMKALVRPPALVLTEFWLPLLDGASLCEVLRRNRTTTRVPILVVTSETRAAELDRVRRAGADTVLAKPAAVDAILRESRHLLARTEALREESLALSQVIAKQLDISVQLHERSEEQRRAITARPQALDGRPKNRLLALLPPDEFRRLSSHLRTVPVRRQQVLHKQGEPIEYVYFPNGGVYSVVSVHSTGAMVEAATVGNEGMLGIEAFLVDNAVAAGDTVLQVRDTDAEMLSVRALRDELGECGALRDLLGRYSQILIAQTMQANMCKAIHRVKQRCARWLLTTQDRVHPDEFQLRHEFLAIMLGVQLATVIEVAGSLQRLGLIHYQHGRIRVINRRGLEAASCQCYQIMRASFDRLALPFASL